MQKKTFEQIQHFFKDVSSSKNNRFNFKVVDDKIVSDDFTLTISNEIVYTLIVIKGFNSHKVKELFAYLNGILKPTEIQYVSDVQFKLFV